jgi:Ca-activated chloride channel homolog
MTVLIPAAGFLALTLPAIVALYILRIRRPLRVVPALHLWPDTVRDRQANVPWQRLRRSWLLLLQLLAAAALVAAALRPALPADAALAHHTVVLVDTSASMQAKDVQPSRLDAAKREVDQLIDQLRPDDMMTIISVSASPRVVASAIGQHGPLHDAVRALNPSNGAANLAEALNLAAGVVHPKEAARAILYSDGIVDPLGSSFTQGLPFPVDFHPLGVSSENLAITALSVRAESSARSATARVQNFGRETHSVALEWRADGHLLDVRRIELRPGQAEDLTISLGNDVTSVTARLTGGDLLTVDDLATAVARPARPLRVLLVTPGNLFLQRALRLRPDFVVDVKSPADYRDSGAYAMTVFDRFLPRSLPNGPLWLIDPPRGSTLSGGPAVAIGRVRPVDAGDPLLNHVDLQDVHVARSQDMRRSSFGRVLISSAQTPLVIVRDEPYRQVLIGFDLHESDLPLRVAFPILVENLTEWMLPASVPGRSLHPDEPVTLVPEPGARSVEVKRPDGSRQALAGGSIITFADTDQIGLYTVSQQLTGGSAVSWFTVNLFDPSISALKPADRLVLPPTRTGTAAATHPGQLDLWPWFALVGLGLVCAEWLAFHRGL